MHEIFLAWIIMAFIFISMTFQSRHMYSLVPIRRHVPINSHASRHWKSHDPIKRHTYKGICNRCWVVFIKGAPRSASKLSIDPIHSHASYFGNSTGSNKRSVPIHRTVSSNWNQYILVAWLAEWVAPYFFSVDAGPVLEVPLGECLGTLGQGHTAVRLFAAAAGDNQVWALATHYDRAQEFSLSCQITHKSSWPNELNLTLPPRKGQKRVANHKS